MTEIINKELSSETALDLAFVDSKLQLSFNYDGKGVDGSVSVSVDSEYFLDKLAAAIPGTLDDSIIAMIKLAMKSV